MYTQIPNNGGFEPWLKPTFDMQILTSKKCTILMYWSVHCCDAHNFRVLDSWD